VSSTCAQPDGLSAEVRHAAGSDWRRILIEIARRKKRETHGGDRKRIDLDAADLES
jgi:hypothetical protein